MLTTIDSGFFNRSIGLGIDGPTSENAVDEVLAFFRSAEQTEFTLPVSPLARPSSLEVWLGARGPETGEELPDRPNPSYRNMLRTGFKLAYPRQNWLSPEPSTRVAAASAG